jgi:hypothetical protein
MGIVVHDNIVKVSITPTPSPRAVVVVDKSPLRILGIGLKGDKGDPGIPGPEYGTYTHIQANAATVWNITHNLNKYPKVVTIDSSMSLEEVYGDVRYVDLNRLDVIFGSPFTGEAYLS